MKRAMSVGVLLALLLTTLAWGTHLASAAHSPATHKSTKTSKAAAQQTAPAVKGVIGTVSAVNGASFTVKGLSGKVITVNTTAATKFRGARGTATIASVKTGAFVAVRGAVTGSTVAAATVAILPPFTGGAVTAVGPTSITLTGWDNKTHTVQVSATTAYYNGITPSTLAGVTVGSHIVAVGTQNADGSLAARYVAILVPFAAGVVSGVSSATITVLPLPFHLPGYTPPTTIATSSSTTFFDVATFSRGSIASVTPGTAVAAIGTLGAGGTTLNATTVAVVPASLLQRFAASIGLGALFGG